MRRLLSGAAGQRDVLLLVAAGYALAATLLIVPGSVAVSGMERLHVVSRNLYAHPFTVSNAALEARASALRLHNRMLLIALSGNPAETRRLSTEAAVLNDEIRKYMAVVRANFLGDPGAVREAERQLAQWESLLARTVEFSLQGERDRALALVTGDNAAQFDGLSRAIDQIVAYARWRANVFVRESAQEVMTAAYRDGPHVHPQTLPDAAPAGSVSQTGIVNSRHDAKEQ